MQKDKTIKFVENCYRRYEQSMYYTALRILHDEGMAEDAVQEAFLKLMKSEKYFEDETSEDCRRFLITVIKNASITIFNKRKRENELLYFTEAEERKGEPVTAKENDGLQIEEVLSCLPSKYSRVVECIAIEEMSVKETANLLHLSEANVRKRYERAKKKLRLLFSNPVKI